MSARPQLADRQVTIGGSRFTLRFSVRAMAALQEHWGLPSFKAVGARMAELGDDLGVDDLVGILWAGLRTHHPDVTKEDVLDLVDAAGMDGLVDAMAAALEGALADGSGEGGRAAATGHPRKTGRSRAS